MIINPVHNAVITPPPPPQNSERRALAAAKLLTLCALTLLVGCGGGGGSGGSSSSGSGSSSSRDCVSPITFPRSITCFVIISPDGADYAIRKRAAENYREYGADYSVPTSGGQTVSGPKYHLRMINAAAAYARGATGSGETIAIVDTGIRDTHVEFNRRGKVTKETQSGYRPDNDDKFHGTFVAALAAGERDGFVSNTNLNMHGVAFDANIAFGEIQLGDPPPPGAYRYFPLENHNDLDDRSEARFYANIINFARRNGAAIVNQSFGVNGAVSRYGRAEVRSRLGHSAAALAQSNTRDADKVIIVWAAGNAGGRSLADGQTPQHDSPDLWAGLGAYFPELQKNTIAVVALDQDGSIADYSNRCGIAKSFCIAAPGSGLVSASSSGNDNYTAFLSNHGGTSFAAPIVSGSLAVLRQYFRGQVGNTELVNRLLATANRNGRYANSNTYGHGLVDLDKATRPVGQMMTGLSGDPNRQPLAGIRFALSGDAFGTAMQQQLAEIEFAAFDELDAPFFLSADTWVSQAARDDGGKREQHDMTLTPVSSFNRGDGHRGTTLSLGFDGDEVEDARLSFAHGWWLSYGDQAGRALGLYAHAPLRLDDGEVMMNHFSDSLAFASPYLSLVRDGPGVGWSRAGGGRFGFALMQGSPLFDGYQKPGGERGLGAVLDMQLSRGLWLQAGAVREREGFLGARLQGALGQAQGTTGFFGINGAWVLGDAGVNDGIGDDMRANKPWRLLASAYLGRTRPQVNGGLVQEVDRLTSSAFSIGAVRESLWRRDDWFGLRLSQPLRTERGNLKMRLPAGRTRYGELVTNDHTLNLAPAGRHLQVEAVYHVPLAGGALQATLGAERHPQHDRSSDIYPTFRVKFERRF